MKGHWLITMFTVLFFYKGSPVMAMSDSELKKILTPMQYNVTRQCGTEPPFHNAYWDNKAAGIYVDVISGHPLFSSVDKFDSESGWPSFSDVINPQEIQKKTDTSLGMRRIEVRAKHSDAHLGHLFHDGPGANTLRYCINSAALRFIPIEKMEEEGYVDRLSLFGDQLETIVLAGGCFWGMEELLREIPGVVATQAGYAGGDIDNPTYEIVKQGKSNHAESVKVIFWKEKVSLDKILSKFFAIHDPTTPNAQGHDRGAQYRSAIFFLSQDQEETAKKIMAQVKKSRWWKKEIVTEIKPLRQFYPAEEYHQKYLKKHPGGYTCHFDRKYSF